nr:MAG TPA: hypothetical protein [Caudoviricetes sp.]
MIAGPWDGARYHNLSSRPLDGGGRFYFSMGVRWRQVVKAGNMRLDSIARVTVLHFCCEFRKNA